ncbi:hypothetical protein HK104_009336, partial [Borealophlyctis nickersoniae]
LIESYLQRDKLAAVEGGIVNALIIHLMRAEQGGEDVGRVLEILEGIGGGLENDQRVRLSDVCHSWLRSADGTFLASVFPFMCKLFRSAASVIDGLRVGGFRVLNSHMKLCSPDALLQVVQVIGETAEADLPEPSRHTLTTFLAHITTHFSNQLESTHSEHTRKAIEDLLKGVEAAVGKLSRREGPRVKKPEVVRAPKVKEPVVEKREEKVAIVAPPPPLAYATPVPFIEYTETTHTESTLAPILATLQSPEFYLRAEAVGVLKRVTAETVTTGKLCEDITLALIKLLDDEDHIVADCLSVLANLASHAPNRPVMFQMGLIPSLTHVLTGYNLAVLERCLRLIKYFACEAPYANDIRHAGGLQLLRVLVHSSNEFIGRDARKCYDWLVELGGEDVRTEAAISVGVNPWEVVLREWRAEDEEADRRFAYVGPKRVKVVKKAMARNAGPVRYDEEFPPDSLTTVKHTPVSTQNGSCRIQKIQILNHHFKIATRLEFYIGNSNGSIEDRVVRPTVQSDPEPGEKLRLSRASSAAASLHVQLPNVADNPKEVINFTRLGYVSLDSNVKTGYRARELKSVHIDAQGDYLKLVVHKCYVNTLNLYNQVGIVAVNVLGEPWNADHLVKTLGDSSKTLGIDPARFDLTSNLKDYNMDAVLRGLINKSHAEHSIPESSDLKFSIENDEHLANLLAAVVSTKNDAVKEERYGLAKVLKQFEELCKKAAEEVARLSISKARAVQLEDYSTAEGIKVVLVRDIEHITFTLTTRLADMGFRLARDGEILRLEQAAEQAPEQVLSPVPPAAQSFVKTVDRPRSATSDEIPPKPVTRNATPAPPPPVAVETPVMPRSSPTEKNEELLPVPTRSGSPPVKGMSAEMMAELGISERRPTVTPPPPHRRLPAKKPAVKPKVHGEYPSTNVDSRPPAGLDPPEELTDSQREEFALPIECFGVYIVQCLLSKQFKLQEWAMGQISGKIDAMAKTPDKKDAIARAGLQVIGHHLGDPREKMMMSTLGLWDKLTTKCVASKVAPSTIIRYLTDMIPHLLWRTGDTNSRIRQKSIEVFQTLVDAYHKEPYSVCPFILRPAPQKKKGAPVHWRLLLADLELLQWILEKYGCKGGNGLELNSVMEFIKPYLENPNHDVREAAISILATMVGTFGEEDEDIVAVVKGLRPPQKAILAERLKKSGKSKKPKKPDTPPPDKELERKPAPKGKQKETSPSKSNVGRAVDKKLARRASSDEEGGARPQKQQNGGRGTRKTKSMPQVPPSSESEELEDEPTIRSRALVGRAGVKPKPKRIDAEKRQRNEDVHSNNWNIDKRV